MGWIFGIRRVLLKLRFKDGLGAEEVVEFVILSRVLCVSRKVCSGFWVVLEFGERGGGWVGRGREDCRGGSC